MARARSRAPRTWPRRRRSEPQPHRHRRRGRSGGALVAICLDRGIPVDAELQALATDEARTDARFRHMAKVVADRTPHLVEEVLADRLSVFTAYDSATNPPARRKAEAKRGKALRPEATVPVHVPANVTANDLVEFRGERRTVAAWASSRGDAAAFPLLAQLKSGQTMAQAMARRT
jgi:hypothetical protein